MRMLFKSISLLQSARYLSKPTTALAPVLRSTAFRKMSSSAPASVLKKPIKISCIQLASGADKDANLKHAAEKVAEAAQSGSKLVVLPECFNSPYGTNYFPNYAETLLPSPPTKEQSPSFHALSAMAAENSIYLVGGSIPELEPETKKYYNTSLTFGPDGKLLATHRKTHLFDIDIPGKITFKESEVLSAGNKVTLVDLPEYGKIGIAICYDVRFPELATIAARRGAFALIYPGAFNLTTGNLHWRLLAQGRAVDNQIYVAFCSPARDMSASYNAWGHSLIVNPMAKILVEADENETTVQAELVGEDIAEARKNIPLNTQRRFDVYPDVSQGQISFDKL
ncbi:hypothetical protein TGAMA5MH_05666 [Trichoderma gamsii]|uniref:CN hydrolase domain-containing protein n=1 Tax=Trichoderma gamsii TaxID=398673 RepID=A0A2K0TBL7_9HYPO|nr:hypothetical protein TGAMA5MH_05666 [Trichoderma gamsii]